MADNEFTEHFNLVKPVAPNTDYPPLFAQSMDTIDTQLEVHRRVLSGFERENQGGFICRQSPIVDGRESYVAYNLNQLHVHVPTWQYEVTDSFEEIPGSRFLLSGFGAAGDLSRTVRLLVRYRFAAMASTASGPGIIHVNPVLSNVDLTAYRQTVVIIPSSSAYKSEMVEVTFVIDGLLPPAGEVYLQAKRFSAGYPASIHGLRYWDGVDTTILHNLTAEVTAFHSNFYDP